MTSSIQLEDVSCPLGCPNSDEVVLTGSDLLNNLAGTFDVVKCRSCGLIRTNPRPTPDTIKFYYPDYYGPYIGTRVQSAPERPINGFTRLCKRLFVRLFDFQRAILPSMAPGRMLEIGCASGAFMHKMAGQGWVVQGIELSETAAQAASQLGYRVHAGPLEFAPAPEERFDLIVGWMVLEHLHDPVGGLKKMSEWVKPDGWLVLSVPNANARSFQVFKHRWYDLHLPNHLYHFTPRTMSLVFEASGWKMEKVYHQRVLGNLLASLGYALRDKGYVKLGKRLVGFPESSGRWNYVLYPLAWILSMFGQTGRMTVWARVKS